MRRHYSVMTPARGFTLLELLVAIVIFALVAAMAYSGLHSVLTARSATDQSALRLRALQQTRLMLERDLSEAVARGIRDEYGDAKPALSGSDGWLEFTRDGWANPTQQPRSEEQRVAFAVRDNALSLMIWQVLDRTPETKPAETVLLDNVTTMTLRFLDASDQWQLQWPPQQGSGTTAAPPLPRAVEVTLELKQGGKLRWLFALPGNAP